MVSAIEFYGERLITYSLGNFIFDQEWSTETKQGIILKCIFWDNELKSAELVPIQIEDYNQPGILTQEEGKPILDRIWKASGF